MAPRRHAAPIAEDGDHAQSLKECAKFAAMGAARKIQSEIDRTMKKVQEGIDAFDEIWDKVRISWQVTRRPEDTSSCLVH